MFFSEKNQENHVREYFQYDATADGSVLTATGYKEHTTVCCQKEKKSLLNTNLSIIF